MYHYVFKENIILLLAKTSQLILRNSKIFKYKKIFFSGNIQDMFPSILPTIKTKIHLQKHFFSLNFHMLKNINQINIYNHLVVTSHATKNYNALIYYWPKNKKEAQFHLINLLSTFNLGTEIFIVGENTSGVKSGSKILSPWVKLQVLDKAQHSILSTGILTQKPIFLLDNFFHIHKWNNLFIKSLPGVFGYKKIDEGSKLLTSTFSKNIKGKILDLGSGSGFLSASLATFSTDIFLTLIDNSTAALISSQATLDLNNIRGKVMLSDLYSNISTKFNMIISNPPFHTNLKKNFYIISNMIVEAKKYLTLNGELRFVTNSCFNYDFLLQKNFKKYKILKKSNRYKVYQAILI